jgi:phosphopantothenoylcysteine decarboxylase/phosphopantothenate--cysteine ligase
MELQGKRIVLGVTGGIAAYKAAELVRLLVKAGAAVDVAMTEAATKFVGPVTFQALSGHPVFTDAWDTRFANGMAHIDLTRGADLVLVAPASADFLAKVAHGLADDLLSTLVLARDCPLLVAPAMNRQMWENPATRRNVATLRGDGVTLLGPDAGDQACGEVGEGRMLEAAALYEEIVAFLQPKVLSGRRVLLTAGPTFEAIDPVRGLTNLSTGKMGFALARAAREAGADVVLVAGPVCQPTPRGVRRIDVTSAAEMHAAVMAEAPAADIFVGVAAVADYRPTSPARDKIKKGGKAPEIELVQNPDILRDVAAMKAPPFCVGFAAESGNLDAYAEKKRREKQLPLVVGNLVQDGFGGDTNAVVLYDAEGRHLLPPGPKALLARALVLEIARRCGVEPDGDARN